MDFAIVDRFSSQGFRVYEWSFRSSRVPELNVLSALPNEYLLETI
jgi:hypothetical protein